MAIGDKTRVCDWFRVNGEAATWREPRRELRLASWSEKAGEEEERGGCCVGVDDLKPAFANVDELRSLLGDESWFRLDNVNAPILILCAEFSSKGESGKAGDRSDRPPSKDPDRLS